MNESDLKILVIEETKTTPSVIINLEKKILKISGSTNCEGPPLFYSKIYGFLDNSQCVTGKDDFIVDFDLSHFNTGSIKCILGLLKRLSKFNENGNKVIVNWFYNKSERDTLEIGEDLSYFVDYHFNFHPRVFNERDI